MLYRILTATPLVALPLMLAGCGGVKLNQEAKFTVQPGESKIFTLDPAKSPNTIKVDLSSDQPVTIDVFEMSKQAAIKDARDKNKAPAKEDVWAMHEKVIAQKFEVVVPANATCVVQVTPGTKAAAVTLKMKNF